MQSNAFEDLPDKLHCHIFAFFYCYLDRLLGFLQSHFGVSPGRVTGCKTKPMQSPIRTDCKPRANNSLFGDENGGIPGEGVDIPRLTGVH